MTEVEKWLKKYGKSNVTSNTNRTAQSTNTGTAKKRDINEIIKAKFEKNPWYAKTPEQQLEHKKQKTPPEYYPGVRTKSMNLPLHRANDFIQNEIDTITCYGGRILNLQTAPTSMYGFQTMYVTIIYEMPDWEHIIS